MKEKTVAMRKLLTGVTIVTAKVDEKVNGFTVAWITPVSHDPPLVGVAVHPKRYTLELIRKSGSFCVNILKEGEEGIELARHFGLKSGRNLDKFEGHLWAEGHTGSPVMKDAVAYLDCKFYSSCDAGDHIMVFGEVVDHGKRGDDDLLVYRSTDYWG